MGVVLYLVGPKEGDHKPWVLTGEKAVAERFAEEMDGIVTVKEVPVPTVHPHVKR